MISWFTGSVPSTTRSMYLLISTRRRSKPCSDVIFSATCVASVLTVLSLTSRSRCSTPISSASNASMDDGTCTKVFSSFCVPSSRISFSSRYALVGMPTLSGLTSTMTKAGLGW